ncbi:unnamed protein product, partial [Musa textilis]
KKSALQPNPRRVFDSLRPVVLWFPLSSARPREKPTEKGDREKKANETKKTVASTALLGISGPWGSSIPCSLRVFGFCPLLDVVDFSPCISVPDRFSRRRVSVFPRGLGLSVAYHFLKSSSRWIVVIHQDLLAEVAMTQKP